MQVSPASKPRGTWPFAIGLGGDCRRLFCSVPSQLLPHQSGGGSGIAVELAVLAELTLLEICPPMLRAAQLARRGEISLALSASSSDLITSVQMRVSSWRSDVSAFSAVNPFCRFGADCTPTDSKSATRPDKAQDRSCNHRESPCNAAVNPSGSAAPDARLGCCAVASAVAVQERSAC